MGLDIGREEESSIGCGGVVDNTRFDILDAGFYGFLIWKTSLFRVFQDSSSNRGEEYLRFGGGLAKGSIQYLVEI